MFSGINAPEMRNDLALMAAKPVRALRSGRFWLSPLIARLSPLHGAMMDAFRLEEEGRFAEAFAAWKKLEGPRTGSGGMSRSLRLARLALRAGDFAESAKRFDALLLRYPGDGRALRGLENAALRGARDAQSKGQWLAACQMWAAFHRAGGDQEKSVRNLGDCARYVAQSADSVDKLGDALEAWGLLKAVDQYSDEAQQGMEWCRLSLARAAERAGNAASARTHWNALLELSPGDQRAQDGLKRLNPAAA
jgi:tetratricopeptide (TPR) repeat protein